MLMENSSISPRSSHIGSKNLRDSEFINKTEKIEAYLNTKKNSSFMFNIPKFEEIHRKPTPVKSSNFHQDIRRRSQLSKDFLQYSERKDNIKVSDLDESQLLEVFLN